MASKIAVLRGLYLLVNVIDFEILPPARQGLPGTVDTWLAAMGELTDEQVDTAFAHFLRTLTSDYNQKPRPGDVLKFAERVQTGGWEAGWKEYLGRAQSARVFLGFAQSQPWSSPLVKAAVDACGGTRALAEADVSKHPFIQKQFQAAYTAALEDKQVKATLKAVGQPEIGQRSELISPDPVQQLEAERAHLARCVEVSIAPVSQRTFTEADAQAEIEKLKALRRQQMGAGPLPQQQKPIAAEPGPSGMISLGGAIQRVKDRPLTQQIGELMDGLKEFEEGNQA